MHLKILLAFLFVALSLPTWAQKVITGKISDENQQPLVGASVYEPNTFGGTITDLEGDFSLKVTDKTRQIAVSYVGYETRYIDLTGNETNLQITMVSNSNLLNEVVLVGTRGINNSRTVTNSPVPIDVVNIKDLQLSNPLLSVNDLLNYVISSFNANRQSASDGTEHIDPASLRGLGPDQVLVLINGKRRHTTSLVNYQNTVGNGSVGTDLSAIPAAAIDRIEVLRDGASAQYGSDAIAGVINIILKKDTQLTINATGGSTSAGDGTTLDLNGSYGRLIGKKGGHFNVAFQGNRRGSTNRSQNHDLIIFDQSALGNFFAYDFTENPAASRAYDDSIILARGLTRDDFDFQVGDAQILNLQAFVNASLPISKKVELYAFGGSSIRQGVGFGFRRLPSEYGNVVLSLYPNGFQPRLGSNILDGSLAVGARISIDERSMLDISNTIGSNVFGYRVLNTNNASYGNQSATEFDAGSHQFLQNTFNADYTTHFDQVLAGLKLGLGTELRIENYQIKAGEEASYAKSTIDPDGVAGAQSFPGFSPLNVIDKSRNSTALYADAEINLTKRLLLSGAARFEDYSDFGSTLNSKVAARYAFADAFALRGAYSTGFRAPSLHQQYFNNIATDVVDGVLLNSGIFTNYSPIAAALGIPKLKQETSRNASIGFTLTPSSSFHVTVDVYQIDVNDRIVLTGNLGNDPYGEPIPELRALFATAGAATGRFFTNAINTRTRGIDVVLSFRQKVGKGILGAVASGNFNDNKVVSLNALPVSLLGQEDVYYGPQERSLIETNAPRIKGTVQLNYSLNKWNVLLRNTYFGKVTRNGFPFGGEQVHAGKLVTDLSLSYQLAINTQLSVGANNLFNVFPDLQIYENSYFGVFKYAPVQMGTTGAFYFVRLTYQVK